MSQPYTPDAQTIAVYDAKAQDYAKLTCATAPDTQMQAFLAVLPQGALVVDLGCGPGRSAGILARAGHAVLAIDPSQAMIALAQQQPGVTAQLGTFDDLPKGPFDGIWANFSLLHATPAAFPGHLARIADALAPGGVFHIGMKTGSGTARDALGRRYTYITPEELRAQICALGLTILQEWTGCDTGLSGTKDPWVCILSQKGNAP